MAAPLISRGRLRAFAGIPVEYSVAALDLIRSSIVIDLLGLLTLDYRKLIEWQTRPETFRDADLARLKASGVTVFHPAVGFTEGDIRQLTLADITRWNAFLATRPADFLRVTSPGDFERAKAEGKIGILLGFQNSEHFQTEDDVDRFYGLGQRISQLTYHRNRLGGGSTDVRDEGLTDFGARVVARMNAVGMAIDVSHCGDRTTLEIIDASTKPVLATHTNCRVLVPGSGRCKTDEAIRKVASSGGVLGMTMVRPFVRTGGPAGIEEVLDHVDHVVKLVGVEHVAMGTDQDLDGRDHGDGGAEALRSGRRSLQPEGFRFHRRPLAPQVFPSGHRIDSGWERASRHATDLRAFRDGPAEICLARTINRRGAGPM